MPLGGALQYLRHVSGGIDAVPFRRTDQRDDARHSQSFDGALGRRVGDAQFLGNAPHHPKRGVGLTSVGGLPGHRERETIAIYAHPDDGALRAAATYAAAVIAQAMEYRAEPLLQGETTSIELLREKFYNSQ